MGLSGADDVPGLAGAGPYAPLPLPALEPDYRVAKPRWELLTRFEAEVQALALPPCMRFSARTGAAEGSANDGSRRTERGSASATSFYST